LRPERISSLCFLILYTDYIIQSKSICIKDLNYQFQRVQCQYPRAQFDIVNAGLYNSTSYVNGTLLAWCLPITKYTPLVSTVTNALMAQCSQYSCLIVMKTIDSLIGDPSINKDDLVLDINYSCRNAGKYRCNFLATTKSRKMSATEKETTENSVLNLFLV